MKSKNRHRSNWKKQRFSPLPSPSHLFPGKPRAILYHISSPVPSYLVFPKSSCLLKWGNPQIFPPVKDKCIADLDRLLRPGFFRSPALSLLYRHGFRLQQGALFSSPAWHGFRTQQGAFLESLAWHGFRPRHRAHMPSPSPHFIFPCSSSGLPSLAWDILVFHLRATSWFFPNRFRLAKDEPVSTRTWSTSAIARLWSESGTKQRGNCSSPSSILPQQTRFYFSCWVRHRIHALGMP